MMKFYLSIILLSAASILFSQNIQVDTTTFSDEELVRDVLINSSCAEVSNIQTISARDHLSTVSSIAYFTNTNQNLPMSAGIMLTTGEVNQATGPNTTTQSFELANWVGDQQLFDYMQGLGIDSGLESYNNATVLQFDFVPATDQISFNFIFLSEEYGNFQCDFSDAFAFFLTNQDTGEVDNLAIVPNTTDPISVITVRDNQFNNQCNSRNPDFFGNFYGENGLPVTTAPHNFNGQTTLMTASSDVTPMGNYSIKLVIADRNDGSFDSAVFLEEGSFNLGVNLGEDLSIENGTAVCEQTSQTLEVDEVQGGTYTWFLNENEIPNSNSSQLTIDTPGTYRIRVDIDGSTCSFEDEILVEFVEFDVADAADLSQIAEDCLSNANEVRFDLTQNGLDQLGIVNEDFTLTYFTSLADAENEQNAIPQNELTTFSSPGNGEEIFVLATHNVFGCKYIRPFALVRNVFDVNQNIPAIESCDDGVNTGVATFDLTQNENQISTTPEAFTFSYFLSESDAQNQQNPINTPTNFQGNNNQTIWVNLAPNDIEGCNTQVSFILEVLPSPSLLEVAPFELCDLEGDDQEVFDLTTQNDNFIGSQNNVAISYHLTQSDAENNQNAITSTNQPGTVFVRLEQTDNGCVVINTLELVLLPLPQVPTEVNIELCDNAADGTEIWDITTVDAEILENATDAEIQGYFNTLAAAQSNDANQQIDNPTAFSSGPNSVFARIVGQNGCFNTVEIALNLFDPPQINQPQNLSACDLNGDGEQLFDLTSIEEELLNGQNSLSVRYFENLDDAQENNNNFIQTPAEYSMNLGTVTLHAVVFEIENCTSIVSFDVTLEESLPIQDASLELCDLENDDTEIFDLTSAENSIGMGANFSYTYHNSLQDATQQQNAIANPTQYNSAGNETIFVNVSDGQCNSLAELEIVLNPLPQIQPVVEELCDTDFDGNFELDSNAIFTKLFSQGNADDFEITFHNSQTDAEAGANAFTLESLNPVQNLPQNFFVRVTNPTTLCFDVTTIALEQNEATPIETNIDNLLACETSNGMASFVLSEVQPSSANNATYTYHETLADAQNQQNQLASEGVLLGNTTIFVRAEAPGLCPSITSFQTEVVPATPVQILADVTEICENEFATLTIANPLGEGFEYVWSNAQGQTLQPNENGALMIAGENGTQTITLTVINTTVPQNCSYTDEITIQVISSPTIVNVEVDGNTLIVEAIGEGTLEYSIDQGESWQISPIFDDLTNGPYTVWVRSQEAGCIGNAVTTLVLGIYNVITPNGDGINDTFFISNLDAFQNENGEVLPTSCRVFDRYGKIIFEQNTSAARPFILWDGTYLGRQLPNSDYWYILQLPDGREFTGHITVKSK